MMKKKNVEQVSSMSPKQHPVGFGFQPSDSTKLSDEVFRTLELTLVKTFYGTMEEAVHLIEEDLEYLDDVAGEEGIAMYNIVDPKIDGWSTKLIWKELTKYGD